MVTSNFEVYMRSYPSTKDLFEAIGTNEETVGQQLVNTKSY